MRASGDQTMPSMTLRSYSRMRTIAALLLFLSPSVLLPQPSPPRFMFIYRDSLKTGVDSAFNAIENEAAQFCADLRCPNP